MNRITKFLEEKGFITIFPLEEKDLLDTYNEIVIGNKNKNDINEQMLNHLMGTLEGLKLIDIKKFIPDYTSYDVALQGEIWELFNSIKFYYDLEDKDFFYQYIIRTEEEVESFLSNEQALDAIKILFERTVPPNFVQFIFKNKDRLVLEIEDLIGDAVKKLAIEAEVFAGLLEIIPKVVMDLGQAK
ncbi:hypothetical protein MZM54_03955 [[Brevibacterium] frigoritolerans]|nr:hypothetical protein [Peribacillus frigoritolerans]